MAVQSGLEVDSDWDEAGESRTEHAAPARGRGWFLLKRHAGPRPPSCPETQNDDKLQRIQKRATEVINGLDALIYEERLKGLIICIVVTEELRRV